MVEGGRLGQVGQYACLEGGGFWSQFETIEAGDCCPLVAFGPDPPSTEAVRLEVCL